MAQFSRTWWGQQFIAALEQLVDAGRLSRGRSYARGSKVKSFEIKNGLVTAKVRGSVNPYFGVYKEPLYTTTIEFQSISKANWAAAIAYVASKASLISRLMLNEIPDTIEDAFAKLDLNLLPGRRKGDFITTCSCPDWSNPCKHIAGVHYLIAQQLDDDPFLLFELRGLSRQDLQTELAKSPLGQALSAEMTAQQTTPEPDETYYTQPMIQALEVSDLKTFWQGSKRLPQTVDLSAPATVPAVLIKKQGNYPAFWPKDSSFIAVMEELYERVRNKNSSVL
ncbi:MAG: SWIM zinc finger family protein [Thermosynechococcaceae cyanobacterium]